MRQRQYSIVSLILFYNLKQSMRQIEVTDYNENSIIDKLLSSEIRADDSRLIIKNIKESISRQKLVNK